MSCIAIKLRRARMRASVALACVCALLLLGAINSLKPVQEPSILRSSDDAVKVQFIGESLCPDCAAFTTDVLEPIFAAGLNRYWQPALLNERVGGMPGCLGSPCTDCALTLHGPAERRYIQLDYVGYGNAKNSSGSVTCQHGPRECELNRALNCAQRLAASQEAFFNFLYCLESTAFGSSSQDVLQTCSGDAGVDEAALRDCTYGSLGGASWALQSMCQNGMPSNVLHCIGCTCSVWVPVIGAWYTTLKWTSSQGRSWSKRQQSQRRRTNTFPGSWLTASRLVRPSLYGAGLVDTRSLMLLLTCVMEPLAGPDMRL